MIVVSRLPAMNLSREHGSIFSVPSPVCWKTIISPAFSPQPAVFSQAQVKDFCCLCISWISSPPIPPICLDPSECHPCPRMYWPSFSVVCKIGAFYLFQVTVEQTNKPPTRQVPGWRIPPVTGVHVGYKQWAATLWFCQFFMHLVVHLTPLHLNVDAKLLGEISHPWI